MPKQHSVGQDINTFAGNLSLYQTGTFAGQINWFLIRVIALVCIPDKNPPFPRIWQNHMLFLYKGRPVFIINFQFPVEPCLLF